MQKILSITKPKKRHLSVFRNIDWHLHIILNSIIQLVFINFFIFLFMISISGMEITKDQAMFTVNVSLTVFSALFLIFLTIIISKKDIYIFGKNILFLFLNSEHFGFYNSILILINFLYLIIGIVTNLYSKYAYSFSASLLSMICSIILIIISFIFIVGSEEKYYYSYLKSNGLLTSDRKFSIKDLENYNFGLQALSITNNETLSVINTAIAISFMNLDDYIQNETFYKVNLINIKNYIFIINKISTKLKTDVELFYFSFFVLNSIYKLIRMCLERKEYSISFLLMRCYFSNFLLVLNKFINNKVSCKMIKDYLSNDHSSFLDKTKFIEAFEKRLTIINSIISNDSKNNLCNLHSKNHSNFSKLDNKKLCELEKKILESEKKYFELSQCLPSNKEK